MVMLYCMLDWTKLEFYMQFWAAVITKKKEREREKDNWREFRRETKK